MREMMRSVYIHNEYPIMNCKRGASCILSYAWSVTFHIYCSSISIAEFGLTVRPHVRIVTTLSLANRAA